MAATLHDGIDAERHGGARADEDEGDHATISLGSGSPSRALAVSRPALERRLALACIVARLISKFRGDMCASHDCKAGSRLSLCHRRLKAKAGDYR